MSPSPKEIAQQVALQKYSIEAAAWKTHGAYRRERCLLISWHVFRDSDIWEIPLPTKEL